MRKFKIDKKISKRLAALSASGIIFVTALTGCKKEGQTQLETTQPEPTTTKPSITMSIDDLGSELEFPKETKPQVGEITGKVDVNTIVEKNDKVYVDQESADKANTVGTTITDTKDDTLTVDPTTGKVNDTTPGYEIVDENNSVIESGNNEEDLLKGYITLDKNYYYKDGTLAFAKGSIVSEEDFNKYKDYLITDLNDAIIVEETTEPTTIPTEPTTIPTESTTSSNEGVVNEDGTYTIFGLTFESKADYEQWVLQGYEGYSEVDGIMISEEELAARYQYTK